VAIGDRNEPEVVLFSKECFRGFHKPVRNDTAPAQTNQTCENQSQGEDRGKNQGDHHPTAGLQQLQNCFLSDTGARGRLRFLSEKWWTQKKKAIHFDRDYLNARTGEVQTGSVQDTPGAP
jgi:hypothetical protein